MPYSKGDGGDLNNYAPTPKISEAAPPDKHQRQIYILAGMTGLFIIGGLVFIAYSVSSVGYNRHNEEAIPLGGNRVSPQTDI